jgi:hypothetical protein
MYECILNSGTDPSTAKLKSQQGVRPPNASESQILRELALEVIKKAFFGVDILQAMY